MDTDIQIGPQLDNALSDPLKETQSRIKSKSIAAIIPAFNERGRVGRVLQVAQQVDELDEIIVVDDGSRDGTYDEVMGYAASEPRLRCLRLKTNQGKGAAMFAGADSTHSGLLLFLDADLLGLQSEHIRMLVKPVSSGQYDMLVGVFRGGRIHTDLAHIASPWLSGQRCLRASLFNHVPRSTAYGYSIEAAITITARREGWKYRYVAWRGVWHPTSEARRGLVRGMGNRWKMYSEILKLIWRESALPSRKAARRERGGASNP